MAPSIAQKGIMRQACRPGVAASRQGVRCRVAAERPASSVSVTTAMEDLRKTRLISALKTPYLESGKFDLARYDALLEDQIKNGVEGVIVGGTTGEGQLMSWDEHIMLIAHTVNAFGRDIKVIGNTGSNSTREALHATEQGFNVGMHASLQINPYYGKTSVGGVKEHFRRAMDMGPAMIYNVSARTGQDITTDVMLEMAEHHNFIGVKGKDVRSSSSHLDFPADSCRFPSFRFSFGGQSARATRGLPTIPPRASAAGAGTTTRRTTRGTRPGRSASFRSPPTSFPGSSPG